MPTTSNVYIYSFADLGIPPGFAPAPGSSYTTSATASPDILSVSDNESFFHASSVADANQVLATSLNIDGSSVGNGGDLVYVDNGFFTFASATGSLIQGFLVIVEDPSTMPPTANVVGVATTQPVPANTEHTYSAGSTTSSIPYNALANCFTRDTMIECENGPVAVQDILAGDLVITRNNGLQTVRWVGHRVVMGVGNMAPICFKAGALGNSDDLRVSPMHRMLVRGARAEVLFGKDEVLAHAAHLCDGDQVFKEPCAEVTYFHILFDGHEIIRAHGCWSESFAPNEAAIGEVDEQSRAELLKLFPELGADWQDALPTLTAAEAALVM